MGLQVRLPLNGSLRNYGAANINMVPVNQSNLQFNNGLAGQGIKFIGTNINQAIHDSNKCQDLRYTDNFSWCLWVKDANVGSAELSFLFTVGRADGVPYGYGLEITAITGATAGQNDIQFSFRFGDANYAITASSSQWNFVAFTKSGASIKLYVNDTITEKTFSGTLPEYSNKEYPNYYRGLGIGCFRFSRNIYPGVGTINDFRIYDHCLSKYEIEDIKKGLFLHLPLDSMDCMDAIYSDDAETTTAANDTSINRYIATKANCRYKLVFDAKSSANLNGNQLFLKQYCTAMNVYRSDYARITVDTKTYYQRFEVDMIMPSAYPILQLGYRSTNDSNISTTVKNVRLYSMIDNISDISGYNNTAIPVGASNIDFVYDTGMAGRCMKTTGSSGLYISESSNITPNKFSYSLWIKPNSNTQTEKTLIAKGNSTKLQVSTNGLKVFAKFYDSNGNQVTVTKENALTVDSWCHIAVTYGTSFKLYINGVLAETKNNSQIAYENGVYCIGNLGGINGTNISNGFTGLIKNIRMYATELPQSYITYLYNSKK